jgi:hypothetical protein
VVEDEAERKTILQNRVAELSKPHRDTLGAIITHLAK